MHSANREDLTSKAAIRNEALMLIAAKGAEAVTVREIAKAAGVSPSLVMHHFGGKQQLVDAVEDYAAAVFDSIIEELSDTGGSTGTAAVLDAGSLSQVFVGNLPPGSPLPAYLCRLLLERGPAGRRLFQRWHATTSEFYDSLVVAGVARPSQDPAVRAAFLLANDLAMILLRELIADVAGVDPLTPEGAERWAEEVMDVYVHGAFVPTTEEQT